MYVLRLPQPVTPIVYSKRCTPYAEAKRPCTAGWLGEYCANTVLALPLGPRPLDLRPNRPTDSTASPNPGTSRRFPNFPVQVWLWRAAPGNAGTAWVHPSKPGYAQDPGRCNKFSRLSGS